MAVHREDWIDKLNKRFIPKGIKQQEWNEMSIPQQMKMTLEQIHLIVSFVMQFLTIPGDSLNLATNPWLSRLGTVFVWASTLTYLYVIVRYIIPEYFEHYSESFQFYMKVFFCFMVTQALVNWLCMYFCTSVFRGSTDHAAEDVLTPVSLKTTKDYILEKEEQCHGQKESLVDCHGQTPNNHVTTKILMEDTYSSKTGLLWEYCEKCKLAKPPRAHHCKVCNVCILKRDHHCFFANTCIGYYNQRYFVVFLFYMTLGCCVGLWLETEYIRWKMAEASWWEFPLPMTLYKYFTGQIPLYFLFIMCHMHSFFPVGFLCLGLFVSQIWVISMGKTSYEVRKKLRIKSVRDPMYNFQSVFGAFWLINFIFPAVIAFRQPGNGKHWEDIKRY